MSPPDHNIIFGLSHPWYHCLFHQFCYPDYRNHRLNESANPTVPALRECIFHHHQYQCDNLDEVFKPGQLNTCWSDLAYCEAPPPSLSSSPPRAQECRTAAACWWDWCRKQIDMELPVGGCQVAQLHISRVPTSPSYPHLRFVTQSRGLTHKTSSLY